MATSSIIYLCFIVGRNCSLLKLFEIFGGKILAIQYINDSMQIRIHRRQFNMYQDASIDKNPNYLNSRLLNGTDVLPLQKDDCGLLGSFCLVTFLHTV